MSFISSLSSSEMIVLEQRILYMDKDQKRKFLEAVEFYECKPSMGWTEYNWSLPERFFVPNGLFCEWYPIVRR